MNAIFVVMLMVSADLNTQEHIQAGDIALQTNNWAEASINFQAALDSGELNIIGRAICYWNVHLAENNLGNTNKDMAALLGFIVYGSDYLRSQQSLPKWFEDGLLLKQKLSIAIALIQATWAAKNSYSCRSKIFSCYVKSKRYIDIFEKTIPFCMKDEVLNIKIIDHNTTFETDVVCGSKTKDYHKKYYFTTDNEY